MKIEKAILLAAGFGVRMKPVTDTTPKSLLPLGKELLIDHQLKFLAASGIKTVAINLHHLGMKIRAHVGNGSRYGLKVVYSEEPEILGTGGGVKRAAGLIGGAPFVVLNCDALVEVEIEDVIKHHIRCGADATMVVKKISKGENYTPVNVNDRNFVDAFGKGDHFYAGLNIAGQKLVDILPPAGKNSCLVKNGWQRLIETGGRISAFVTDGYFSDVGTPERYEEAKNHFNL